MTPIKLTNKTQIIKLLQAQDKCIIDLKNTHNLLTLGKITLLKYNNDVMLINKEFDETFQNIKGE